MSLKYFIGITDAEAFKARYRELCKELHPDTGGNAATFQDMLAEYKMFQKKGLDPDLHGGPWVNESVNVGTDFFRPGVHVDVNVNWGGNVGRSCRPGQPPPLQGGLHVPGYSGGYGGPLYRDAGANPTKPKPPPANVASAWDNFNKTFEETFGGKKK